MGDTKMELPYPGYADTEDIFGISRGPPVPAKEIGPMLAFFSQTPDDGCRNFIYDAGIRLVNERD